jgi:hypothetical protein
VNLSYVTARVSHRPQTLRSRAAARTAAERRPCRSTANIRRNQRTAFGALMRGPLVGLTEEELLDVTGALAVQPDRPDRMPRFSQAAVPLTWIRPSDHDPDRIPMTEAIELELGDAPEVAAPVGAGRIRGLLLHKLMEEVLTGELAEDVGEFAARARELMGEMVLEPDEGTAPCKTRFVGRRMAYLIRSASRNS